MSESRRTRGHILLSQIWEFLFVASYDPKDHGGGIRPPLHTGESSQSQSYIVTDCQSFRTSWCGAPYGAHDQIIIMCDSYRLVLVGALSDERMGLSFVYDAGSWQRSLYWVWVSSKSKLYYDRRSAGQSVLEQSTHLGLATRSWLLSDSCEFVDLGRPL
jgi:hypothetical protein